MERLRADEEMTGGITHKPMFERLIIYKYAVADLTTANSNEFYDLGIRHADRPHSTLLLIAEGGDQLPFDVAPLRVVPYKLSSEGKPTDTRVKIKVLVNLLNECKKATTDSLLYRLFIDYPKIDLTKSDHTKTDVFRDRVQYSSDMKENYQLPEKKVWRRYVN